MIAVRTIILFLLIVVPACTSVTPYKPYGMIIHEGYRDEKVGEKTYFVQYDANPYTPLETVEHYWHRRAAELCGSGDYESEMRTERRRGATARHVDAAFPYVSGTVRCK